MYESWHTHEKNAESDEPYPPGQMKWMTMVWMHDYPKMVGGGAMTSNAIVDTLSDEASR